MTRKIAAFAIGCCLLLGSYGSRAQTLFTYGNHPVTKAEFLRIYEKNNKPGAANFSEKSLREYLDLYALFRMKVQEAEHLGLDTTAAVREELENYTGQLTRSYLFDKQVTQKLVEEAYERLKTDREVAHILIAVRPNEDSSRAKALTDSLYAVLRHDPGKFGALAAKFSDDKGSAARAGKLGYITALQVVYPFETMAYQTPVGSISEPFRTRFGYHILQVTAERPARGKVQVAQILIASPEYKGTKDHAAALATAQKVAAELKNGASFESMVEKYSDDKFTKNAAGLMEPFGIGKMTPEFEAAAFALQSPGDISKPVQTSYGYHILKLVKKIPLQPLDSIRHQITLQIENDSRSKIAKESYREKVKKQYHFREYEANVAALAHAFESDTAALLDVAQYAAYDKPLFEMDGKSYTQQSLISFIERVTHGKILGKRKNAFEDLYRLYENNTLQQLQEKKLAETNDEFANLVQEYRNGIMLFALMDQKVWNKATADTAGLKAYFHTNQSKYQWNPSLKGSLYLSPNEEEIKLLKTYLGQGIPVQDAINKITNEMHTSTIQSNTGRFDLNKFPLAKTAFVAGQPTPVFKYEDGTYGILFVNELHANPEPKTFEEARGYVVADYQNFLEQQWNETLRAKYPVKINEKVLARMVKN